MSRLSYLTALFRIRGSLDSFTDHIKEVGGAFLLPKAGLLAIYNHYKAVGFAVSSTLAIGASVRN